MTLQTTPCWAHTAASERQIRNWSFIREAQGPLRHQSRPPDGPPARQQTLVTHVSHIFGNQPQSWKYMKPLSSLRGTRSYPWWGSPCDWRTCFKKLLPKIVLTFIMRNVFAYSPCTFPQAPIFPFWRVLFSIGEQLRWWWGGKASVPSMGDLGSIP